MITHPTSPAVSSETIKRTIGFTGSEKSLLQRTLSKTESVKKRLIVDCTYLPTYLVYLHLSTFKRLPLTRWKYDKIRGTKWVGRYLLCKERLSGRERERDISGHVLSWEISKDVDDTEGSCKLFLVVRIRLRVLSIFSRLNFNKRCETWLVLQNN